VRRLCGILVLCSLLLVPAGARAKVPRIPAGWVGVAADGPLLERPAKHRGEWRRMRANRVGFVRAAFVWRDVQPEPGPIDLAPTDAIVLAAAKQGLSVMPESHGTPSWAAVDPGDEGSRPADPAQYAEVIRAFVRRYGPEGTLWAEHPEIEARPIRRWQVWNEPNLTAYWREQPFAPEYVELLRAVREVLDEEDPGAQLILGGMPNRSWQDLRAVYAAGGRGLFDAVALHPYTGEVYDVVRIVRFVRKELRRQRDGRLPVYLTEVSWPASAGHQGRKRDGFNVTDAEQASKLRQALTAFARERRRLRIAGVVWYTWLSAEGTAMPSWSGYSGLRRLRRGDVVTAPSLKAFRETLAALRRR
jgi:hypothetical protein